jgi:hypothetical protein
MQTATLPTLPSPPQQPVNRFWYRCRELHCRQYVTFRSKQINRSWLSKQKLKLSNYSQLHRWAFMKYIYLYHTEHTQRPGETVVIRHGLSVSVCVCMGEGGVNFKSGNISPQACFLLLSVNTWQAKSSKIDPCCGEKSHSWRPAPPTPPTPPFRPACSFISPKPSEVN